MDKFFFENELIISKFKKILSDKMVKFFMWKELLKLWKSDNLLQQAWEQSFEMPELDYEAAGFALKLLSLEKVDGRDAYKLEITDPSGVSSLEYFDAESGYKIMDEKTEETPEGSVLQFSKYEDYREVGGIMYPNKMMGAIGPQTFTATVDSIVFNSDIDDTVFK